jgi:hypothetical protein
MIKTWQQRCEEHPDHDGIVSEGMIRQRMQEEIDELRQALERDADEWYEKTLWGEQPVDAVNMSQERVDEMVKRKHNPEYDFFPWSFKPPPQKDWIGLSDEEIKEIIGPWGDTPVKGYTRKLFDQIEAKLKEKNHG